MSENVRVYPRYEGPQNIASFNRMIKCSRHGKMCSMVCMSAKCEDRTLCVECVLDHTHSHLSKILPLKEFNEQTNIVPSLVNKEFLQLKSQVFTLQNQLVATREARKKELRTLVFSIKELFRQELEIFERQGIEQLEKFFNKPTADMSSHLYTIQNYLTSLEPYLVDTGKPVESSNINYLLNYQDSLIQNVLPSLETKIRQLSQKILANDIFLDSQNFQNRISRSLNKDLNLRLLFTTQPQTKSSTEQIVIMFYRQEEERKGGIAQRKKIRQDIIQIFRYLYNTIFGEICEVCSSYIQIIIMNVKIEDSGMMKSSSQLILNPRFNADKLIDGLEQGPMVKIPRQQVQVDVKVEEYETKEDPEYMKLFTNHTDVVSCVCIVDNTRFASSGGDKMIKIWSIDSGYQLANMQGHLKDVWALIRISSVILASGSADCTVRLWNIDAIACVKVFNGHKDVVKCLSFCGDRQLLASGCADSSIKLWDLTQETNECKSTMTIHGGMVRSMCYVESKGVLISGSSDNLIKVSRVSSRQVLSVLSGHYGEVYCVIHLYDQDEETFIASGGQDKLVIIWNVDKGVQLKQFRGHHDTVNSLAFSQKLQAIVSGSTDKLIIVWDKNGKIKNRIRVHSNLVSSLAYLERRNILISAGWDQHIFALTLRLKDEDEFA